MDRDEKVARIVRHAAMHSPFYRDLYAAASIRVDSIKGAADLVRLPIVESAQLLEHHERFRSQAADIYRISSSSGTSRNPKTLYRTVEDTSTSTSVMQVLFRMSGVRRGDTLLIGQPFDLAHLGYLALDACRAMGVLSIPVGISITDARLLDLVRKYRPNAIFTSPSRMTVLTELVRRRYTVPPIPLQKILLAGERTEEEQRRQISSYWGTEPHSLYGSEETDGLGGTCARRRGIHFMHDFFHLEFLEVGSDRLVTEGPRMGEAIITSLYATGTPLIRYRLGDVLRVDPDTCPCGLESPVIHVHGRASDTLHLYDGIKLFAYQIKAMLEDIDERLTDFQIVCRRVRPGLDEVELRIDAAVAPPVECLKTQIERSIWDCSLDLHAAREIGCLRFEIVVEPGCIERTTRGKTVRVIDQRAER